MKMCTQESMNSSKKAQNVDDLKRYLQPKLKVNRRSQIKDDKGFSYVEVLVSMLIAFLLIQILFTSYSCFQKLYMQDKLGQSAVRYGQEMMHYVKEQMKVAHQVTTQDLQDYLKTRPEAMSGYNYSFIWIPLHTSQQKVEALDVDSANKCSTDKAFDWEGVKQRLASERLLLEVPEQKKALPIGEEIGRITIHSTGEVEVKQVGEQGNVSGHTEDGRIVVTLNTSEGGSGIDQPIVLNIQDDRLLYTQAVTYEIRNNTARPVLIYVEGQPKVLDLIQVQQVEGEPNIWVVATDAYVQREAYWLVGVVTGANSERGYTGAQYFVSCQ
ncbi:MAG: hypothetical protein RSD02_06980 [Niameybacter sp.]